MTRRVINLENLFGILVKESTYAPGPCSLSLFCDQVIGSFVFIWLAVATPQVISHIDLVMSFHGLNSPTPKWTSSIGK